MNIPSLLLRILFSHLLWLGLSLAQADEAPPTPEQLAKIRLANDQCLSCHSEAGLKNPPKSGMDLDKLGKLLVDGQAYAGSDHGQMACAKCHKGNYRDHPHKPDADEPVSECQECHAKKSMRIERQMEKSVHAKHLEESLTCAKCHDAHVMLVAAKLKAPRKIVAQDNKVCVDCHDSDAAYGQLAPAGKKRPRIDEAHAWLPNMDRHWQAVRCVECHTPVDEKIVSHEILDKDKAEKKCGTCHGTDTALRNRLYRHLAKDDPKHYGFLNSVLLTDAYVVGANRHPLLDNILIGLTAATGLGVLLHGLGRLLAAFLRRRKRHD